MKKYALSSKGFTLVELLIVIFLIGIISFLGVLSVTSFNRNQKFVNVANELYSQILLAKSRAQTQVTPTEGSCDGLGGYRIRLKPTYYVVYPVCKDGIPLLPSSDKFNYYPSDTTLTPLVTPASERFTFNVLTGMVTEADANGTIYQLKDGTHTKNFKVYKDGRIEVY